MKKKLIILISVIVSSCSNSEEQMRLHLERIEVGKSLKVNYLEVYLTNLDNQLTDAKLKYEKINQFKLGRSSSKKKKQLVIQLEELNDIQASIERTKKEISLSKLFNSFEFQNTPEGTIEHIFYAARTSDYDKIRHLPDPYGECNESVLELCMIEMKDENSKENWNNLFSYGRIIKKYWETDNEAGIEIAVGENSSQLVKLLLIKRMDRWYLKEV